MKRLLAILLLLGATPAFGGDIVAGAAKRYIRFSSSPATCRPGDTYYNLGTTKIYVCTAAPGTWTVVQYEAGTLFLTSLSNGGATGTATSATGIGTGTATLATGSNDAAGTIQLNPTGVPAALGTARVTLGGSAATNALLCVGNLHSPLGTWNARATLIGNASSNTAQYIWNWDNNAVALTAGSEYDIDYICVKR